MYDDLNVVDMKKYFEYMTIAVAAAVFFLLAVSCDTADELPPLNEGYATTVIMPDPVDLTPEDREYMEAVQDEYEQAIAND